ncbi:xylose isomerase [Candidatus Poribacteria bacterium]|nr:xylose isomerase [Candidatus Poribacteria bacterium]
MKLGVSSYSYWHFTPEKVPIEHVIEEAARLDLDGVEILHRQMASEDRCYTQRLKRLAFLNGLDLHALSIHQGFVSPDADERAKNLAHTVRCIDLAYELGIPSIRLNSGRWNTVGSFTELMALDGIEPRLPGYTDDDAYGWIAGCIEECLPHAERNGVVLALENHWGLTATPEGVNRILSAVESDWLMGAMDCGNFLADPYTKLRAIAQHTALVHAKTYHGGGEWYTLDLDYTRVRDILAEVGFDGYVSLEFEGKEDAHTAVPKSIEMLRAALGIA